MLYKDYLGNHYLDQPLVFLNEILVSAIKFLERLLKITLPKDHTSLKHLALIVNVKS